MNGDDPPIGEGCRHDLEHLERMEIVHFDVPVLCSMCANEADIGIRYSTKLGSIRLCDECLTVLESIAEMYFKEDTS